MPFQPKRVMFEQEALDYTLGRELMARFRSVGVQVNIIGSHNRVTGIPGKTPQQAYAEAKATLVFGVRKTMDFATCKPSAHYQLPLATGCGGKCEYCYLMTTLGKKPYLRAYVNLDQILAQAEQYITQRAPEFTLFEGAATSDPVPVEPFTGSLAKTIEFFAQQPLGRFRFVTKFTDIESLLPVQHGGHTTIRFSLNTERVINQWEHGTPKLLERIHSANKILKSGYPLGFIIAPIFLYEHWQDEYTSLLTTLQQNLDAEPQFFEFITHRFTTAAKNRIEEVFTKSTLPMQPEIRKYKYGQFGYGKYVYPPTEFSTASEFFKERVKELFPHSQVLYFV